MSNGESFPCIICGKTLERVHFFASEAQPSDGIMCETAGNYGSTVWDSMDGERLAFNICDPCMVRAGRQGRVWTRRVYIPILAEGGPVGRMVVGIEHLRDRPHIPWRDDLPRDDEAITMSLDELENLPPHCELTVPVEQIRQMLR